MSMKKGDLVKYNVPQYFKNDVFGIVLSEFDDGYMISWIIKGTFTEPKWYSFRDLVPLTLESSKDLLSKAL
jgi:hypothetical protein